MGEQIIMALAVVIVARWISNNYCYYSVSKTNTLEPEQCQYCRVELTDGCCVVGCGGEQG